jgi:hypothetical protein
MDAWATGRRTLYAPFDDFISGLVSPADLAFTNPAPLLPMPEPAPLTSGARLWHALPEMDITARQNKACPPSHMASRSVATGRRCAAVGPRSTTLMSVMRSAAGCWRRLPSYTCMRMLAMPRRVHLVRSAGHSRPARVMARWQPLDRSSSRLLWWVYASKTPDPTVCRAAAMARSLCTRHSNIHFCRQGFQLAVSIA